MKRIFSTTALKVFQIVHTIRLPLLKKTKEESMTAPGTCFLQSRPPTVPETSGKKRFIGRGYSA